MRVTGLRLVNFRNYPSLTLRPDEGLCVLTGENAAGKTNVLESLFLCSLGLVGYGHKYEEMVRAGEQKSSTRTSVNGRFALRGSKKRITVPAA